MTELRKEKIIGLLKGIETGDPASVEVINPDKYIQHNPETREGRDGLAALFKRLSKSDPKVNIVRIFSDGDFVFGHTEYDFSTSRVGFEVFRFEGDMTVEHWDNIQSRKGPNPSAHSMTDGSTAVTDLDKTEENRSLVKEFIEDILINKQMDNLRSFVFDAYVEHNPALSDGIVSLTEALTRRDSNSNFVISYRKNHRILAEGNFVLSVCEGYKEGEHTSFYDLFRVDDAKIVEHWDTVETVVPRSEWKNDNGKF